MANGPNVETIFLNMKQFSIGFDNTNNLKS
jgi:hypothetical protein